MNNDTDISRMKRDIYEMPEDVRAALTGARLLEAYNSRPAYQQNDYIGWITQAKRDDTRQKRLDQMLDELSAGGLYMKMRWTG